MDIEIVFATPFIDDAGFELLTVTGRAARVGEQNGIAFAA